MSKPNPFTNARIAAVNADPGEYHAVSGVRGRPGFVMSRSELMRFKDNPQKWIRGIQDEATESTEFGDLVDCVFLQPDSFMKRFALLPKDPPRRPSEKQRNAKNPSRSTLEAIVFWDDFNTRHAGKQIVPSDTNGSAHAAVERLMADERIAALLACSDRQVYLLGEYQDSRTGMTVPVKALLDLVPRVGSPFQHCLADLKTARSAAHWLWTKECFNRGYHTQAALYTDLYVAATGQERTDWLHVIVENEPPYEPARRIMAPDFVDLGRQQYLAALRYYCQCLKENKWPSYDDGDDTWNGWSWVYAAPYMVTQAASFTDDEFAKQSTKDAEKYFGIEPQHA